MLEFELEVLWMAPPVGRTDAVYRSREEDSIQVPRTALPAIPCYFCV